MILRTVRDMKNLPFSADTPHRFSKGSHTAIRRHLCSKARIISAARHRSSVRMLRRSIQCGRSPRINAQAYALDRRWVLATETVSLQSRYRWGALFWSAILSFANHCKRTSRRFMFQVIRRCLWRKCVASEHKGTVPSYVHTCLLGFAISRMNLHGIPA